jgi:RNA polymerase sigma-70 factor (ECF subfamily)
MDAVEDQMPLKDAELLAKASLGDQSAFGVLYNRYQADLYRFVSYLAGDSDMAEELFQETWFRAAKNAGKKPVDNFKRWLFRIAVNFHRDELRKQKVRRLVLGNRQTGRLPGHPAGGLEVAAAAHETEGFEIRDAIVRAMDGLTHRQRAVFVLTYVEGFKIREVGEMLGKAEGTIKSTLHRALVILREKLEEFR